MESSEVWQELKAPKNVKILITNTKQKWKSLFHLQLSTKPVALNNNLSTPEASLHTDRNPFTLLFSSSLLNSFRALLKRALEATI